MKSSKGIFLLVLALRLLSPCTSLAEQDSPFRGAIYEVSLEYYPHHSFQELTERLPQLKEMGVSIIYLTPVFQCIGKAQYLIKDFYAINPRYGTEADLKTLVTTAHHYGIRVLLDLETSLTYDGTDIMHDHPDFVLLGKDGTKQRYYPIPEFGWALDDTKPAVIQYFTQVAVYYVKKFDIDGWRVDSPTNNYDPEKVSGDHSHLQLLRSVKAAIRTVKKDTILIGEVSGPTVMFANPTSGQEPLFDEVFEASYNYLFCGFMGGSEKSGYSYILFGWPFSFTNLVPAPLNAVVHDQVTSREFVKSVQNWPIRFHRLRANFIENHDTERVSKAFPNRHPALFVLIASLPGVPVVHAGQEIGSTVHPDASGARDVVVDWNHGDLKRRDFYTRVLRMRANSPALLHGDIKDVWKSGDRSIAFLRTFQGHRVLVALNFTARDISMVADVPGLQSKASYELRDELSGAVQKQTGAQLEYLNLQLAPYGYRLIEIAFRH